MAEFTLENSRVRLTFEDTTNQLLNIEDLVNNYIFDTTDSPMWKMFLLDTTALGGIIVVGDFMIQTALACVAVRSYDATTPGTVKLIWTNIGGTGSVVQLWFTLIADDPKIYTTIYVTNTVVNHSFFAVDFPIIAIKQIDSDLSTMNALIPCLAIGELLEDPVSYLPEFGNAHGINLELQDTKQVKNVHPAQGSTQMSYVYGDAEHGLYYASEDAEGYFKRLFHAGPAAVDPNDRIYLWTRHFGTEQRTVQSDYTSPYNTIILPMLGDWIDAAKEQRSWAEQQTWCQYGPIVDRTERRANPDLAHTLCTLRLNCQEFAGQADIQDAIDWFTNFVSSIDPSLLNNQAIQMQIRGLQTGPNAGIVPSIAGLEAWTPDLFEYTYNQGYRTAKYTQCSVWGYPETANDDALTTRAKSRMFNISAQRMETEAGGILMCPSDMPAAGRWHDKYPGFEADDGDYTGITVVEDLYDYIPFLQDIYLDNGYQSVLCHNAVHTHDEGGGNFYYEGARLCITRFKDGIWDNYGFVPILLGEGNHEMYMDLMEGCGLNYWGILPNTLFDESYPVPLQRAIYSGYSVTAGGIGENPGVNWHEYTLLHPDKFRQNLAETLLNLGGIHFSLYRFGFEHTLTSAEIADHQTMITWLSFIYDQQNYVRLGEWVRPPQLSCGMEAITFSGTKWQVEGVKILTYDRPKIACSAYKHHDENSVGIYLCNWTDEAQSGTMTVDLSEWDIQSTLCRVEKITSPKWITKGQVTDTIFTINLTDIPARKMFGLLVDGSDIFYVDSGTDPPFWNPI